MLNDIQQFNKLSCRPCHSYVAYPHLTLMGISFPIPTPFSLSNSSYSLRHPILFHNYKVLNFPKVRKLVKGVRRR